MSRVINTANPGKRRAQFRRTIAEVLRRLMQKQEIDDEARDMAAALVFALRGIADTVETTTRAWEDRDYYLKADRFRLEWEWVTPAADRLQRIILNGHWGRLPAELATLAGHFSDIKVSKLTRPASTWRASYLLLVEQS